MTSINIPVGMAHVRTTGTALQFGSAGTEVTVQGLTPHQCDRLAQVALVLRERLLDGLEDVCECNAQDLPLFDHDRLCPRRLLAEYRGVQA